MKAIIHGINPKCKIFTSSSSIRAFQTSKSGEIVPTVLFYYSSSFWQKCFPVWNKNMQPLLKIKFRNAKGWYVHLRPRGGYILERMILEQYHDRLPFSCPLSRNLSWPVLEIEIWSLKAVHSKRSNTFPRTKLQKDRKRKKNHRFSNFNTYNLASWIKHLKLVLHMNACGYNSYSL